jgi:hypothetical protein
VITIAHNSGGPQSDIVVPAVNGANGERAARTGTGYLCDSEGSYADALVEVLREFDRDDGKAAGADGAEGAASAAVDTSLLRSTQLNARRHVTRFSEAAFGRALIAALKPQLLPGFRPDIGHSADDPKPH